MLFIESEASKNARVKICHDCEHKVDSDLGPRCGACHCFLQFKVFLKFAKCPLGKWQTIIDPKVKGDHESKN